MNRSNKDRKAAPFLFSAEVPRVFQKKRRPAGMTLNVLAEQWLAQIRERVKPATFCKYEGLVRNHLLPELGGVPLSDFSRELIADFARRRRESGRQGGGALSAKTVNDILVILGLCFEYAEEEYSVTMPKIRYLREERKEARVLTEAEQKRLTAFLLKEMDIYKFGALLALYTGIRIGELCALQWPDIKEDRLRISKTMQRLKVAPGKTIIHIGEPKSRNSHREVPLPAFLSPFVERFRCAEGYVIRTTLSEHSEPRIIQRKFQRITEDCGLEGVTFHTLRHTFATRCVEAGFDVKTLSEILGHSDTKTTLNRYVHSSFALKERYMAMLSLSIG